MGVVQTFFLIIKKNCRQTTLKLKRQCLSFENNIYIFFCISLFIPHFYAQIASFFCRPKAASKFHVRILISFFRRHVAVDTPSFFGHNLNLKVFVCIFFVTQSDAVLFIKFASFDGSASKL